MSQNIGPREQALREAREANSKRERATPQSLMKQLPITSGKKPVKRKRKQP